MSDSNLFNLSMISVKINKKNKGATCEAVTCAMQGN